MQNPVLANIPIRILLHRDISYIYPAPLLEDSLLYSITESVTTVKAWAVTDRGLRNRFF